MKNINSLIGIIKGIAFDDVINENEVSRLELWVDENRILASSNTERQLISLIDDILEDNIVTKEEKNQLLQFANSISDNDNVETGALFELQGIIDGIICDNELNETEIRMLRQWLTNKSSMLDNDETSKIIERKVDDILEDNIVTADEQRELMNLLQSKLDEISNDAKIRELKMMVREKKNIALKILDVIDNQNLVSAINRQAMQILNSAIKSYDIDPNKDYSILFISLCLIALRHYDGNFYEHVRMAYKPVYDRYSEQKVEGTIRTILDQYQYHVDQNGETRVINCVLYNTLVPRMFLESFFEFVFDIYKLNFDYSIPENIEEEFNFVFDGLRKEMQSNDDSLKVNVTRKSYKLIQTTKRLILNEKYKDIVTSFSSIILSLIDNRIMTGEAQFIHNPYISYGYKAWLSTLDNSESRARRRSSDLTESRRVAKFIFENNNVVLQTPVYHISSEIDYSQVAVVVKNGEDELYYDDCPQIKEIIGGYEVDSETIKIDKPLGELQCLLMEGDTVIKSTDNSLFKPVIVFAENGKEIRNHTEYEGIAIVCAPPESNVGGQSFYQSDDYWMYALDVEEGDVFHVDDTLFAFTSYLKPEVLGNIRQNQFLQDVKTGDYLPVYSSVDCLVFESSAGYSNINIVINNHTYSLNELDYSLKGHVNSRVYSVDLHFDESDIYTIEAYETDEIGKALICKETIVLDNCCNVNSTWTDEDTFIVNIDSELCQGKQSREFNISDYEYDWLNLMNRGKQYNYIIPVDLELFRINNGRWRKYEDGIWVGDIQPDSVLEIIDYDADSICVRSEKGEACTELIPLKDKLTHKEVNIGFLKSYKNDNSFVCLWMMQENKVSGVLYCYNKCILDVESTKVYFDNIKGVLNVCPIFHGRGKVRLEITDRFGNEECSSDDVISGQILQVEGLDSFKDYKISLYELVKGLTISNKKERIHTWHRKLFAVNDFPGRYFKVKHVKYYEYSGGREEIRDYRMPNTYVHFKKQEAIDKYTANIVIKQDGKYYSLLKINPVSVELCSGVLDGEMELMITNEGDGLLMDFQHHRVLNSLVGNTPDIYAYYIDVNGVRK